MLKLGDRADDLKEQPADGGAGVDSLVDDNEVDATVLQQLVSSIRCSSEPVEPVEPVELGDHELIARPVR